MHLDPKFFQLFIQNFDEAYRSAKLIILSHHRIGPFFPLSGDVLSTLDIDALDKLDAFRVRFCDLQDGIGNKVFRSILVLELEPYGSNLDILNQMEKRGIISSCDRWHKLRNIRNLFIHDYPETRDFRAGVLTQAYQGTCELVEVLNRIISYFKQVLKIELADFSPLKMMEK